MKERDIAIRIEGLRKRYRLGTIGGGTLKGDLESWWARKRGKEDPNLKIGAKTHTKNEVFYALDGIDLTIYKGERIGIIGHNGAGKSTLLKILSRVTAPTEGRVFLDGRIASMLEVGTGFNGELTGRENIYLNGAILGMTKAEVDAKMEQIIEFSECRQFIDTPVKRYSSGMYVKLAFSVAAHLDSEIMIMDEVLAVGDMAFQKKCLEKMSEVSRNEGRTVLYVSHNMNTIRQLCERCIVLSHGTIIYQGSVEEAIALYSGIDSSLLPYHYDLDNADRPFKQHGHRIHITSFDFLNKDTAVYDIGEEIRFRISFQAEDNISDLKLYFVIKNRTEQRIGMLQSLEGFLNAEKGNKYSHDFVMSFDNLCTGLYSFEVDIFSDDGEGRHWSYDHPLTNICFRIEEKDSKGLLWNQSDYGNVMFNPIKSVKFHT